MKLGFIAMYCTIFFNFINAQVHLGPGQTFSNIEPAVKAGVIHPGDTVYLHKGSYAGYQLISFLKGSPGNWIVIRRFENDLIDISGGWQFVSCEYIKFELLNFKANVKYPARLFSVDNGGSCFTQSNNIKVDSCYFSNVTDASAIAAFKFGGVDNFEVTNNVFRDFPVCSAMDFNVCHDGIISGNLIVNCLTGGHIKGGASNITMQRNIFMNASKAPWVAFELGGDTGAQFYCVNDSFEVKNLKFYSNLVIGGYRGVSLSSATDCKIVNNTFYNCSQATLRFLTTSVLYPKLFRNRVENNIFAFGSSAYFNGSIQTTGSVTFLKNIYYSIFNASFNGPYWDTPDLDAIKDRNPMNFGSNSPMFKDTSNFDFTLKAGSPAIANAANVAEPVYDFYGNPFSVSARSIGAIEYGGVVNTDSHLVSGTNFKIQIYPNPSQDYIFVTQTSKESFFEIFSFAGVKVLDGTTNQIIQISNLASGIYYLKLNSQVFKLFKL
ncbi:MAG: T9SS type A sorting domain-containing protein [Saprospiraceae bacterium]